MIDLLLSFATKDSEGWNFAILELGWLENVNLITFISVHFCLQKDNYYVLLYVFDVEKGHFGWHNLSKYFSQFYIIIVNEFFVDF